MNTSDSTPHRAIPVGPSTARPEPSPAARSPEAGREHARCVLLVDDEPIVLRVARRFLERAGYTVTTSEGGHAALGILGGDGTGVDLLVTDLRMPDMSGIELVTQARRILPRLPVLCMSAHPRGPTDLDTIEYPLLMKPFGSAELCDAVADLLPAGRPDARVLEWRDGESSGSGSSLDPPPNAPRRSRSSQRLRGTELAADRSGQ